MTNKQALLDLADRVEKLDKPSTEVFHECFDAIYMKPKEVWNVDGVLWTREYEAYQAAKVFFFECVSIGAYESAAITLVPEGWEWEAQYNMISDYMAYQVKMGQHIQTEHPSSMMYHDTDDVNPSLPIAITAAALRAIASELE